MQTTINLIGGVMCRIWMICWLLGLMLGLTTGAIAGVDVMPLSGGASKSSAGKISLTLRKVDITEVMEMLSRKERINIVLTEGVTGEVSVNLYEVSLDKAIKYVAAAAGFAVERRNETYFIIERDEVNQYTPAGFTDIRTYKVQYTKPEVVRDILNKHISKYGTVTMLEDRRLLVVEDTPEFLRRIERLLEQVDQQPKQILIEAKILEVTLRDTESFGIDWVRLFSYDSGDGIFGVRGLANPGSPGLFFELLTPNVEVFLDALESSGRLRTLSTPKLLALEGQEAETVIGDRLGYRVTTTINQVTTESIEFLESGVILRVKPSVDGQGRIMLDIHPEVSNGSVSDDGIPSQTTTEVTTRMLVQDGQTVFIGGLMRRSVEQTNEAVPLLGSVPGLRWLFSNHAKRITDTETIVLITPYIINDRGQESAASKISRMQKKQRKFAVQAKRTKHHLRELKKEQNRAAPQSTTRPKVQKVPQATPAVSATRKARPLAPPSNLKASPVAPATRLAVPEYGPLDLWDEDDIL